MKNHRLLTNTRRLLASTGTIGACLLALSIGMNPLPASAAKPKDAISTAGGETRPAVIYHNYCSVCHGDKGDGRSRAQGSLVPPPKDFTNHAVAMQMSRQYMVDVVTNGRPGTAMTGWKTQLNKKEIEAVVDYVRNTFMPAAASKDSESRGRTVFAKNCSVCHGEKGDGNSRAKNSMFPPPRDFTSPAARVELTTERMIRSVTYGRPETAMAGFHTQLSDEDIKAVVAYIRSGLMASSNNDGISGTHAGARQAAPNEGDANALHTAAASTTRKTVAANMAAAMPKNLKGDAAKGAGFYMSNCSTCHGTTGDGRGPRAYFINPKPRNFLHPASRSELNRVAMFNAVKEGKLGTEMPAWGKVLTDQEIADVSEFVFQRFIQVQGNKQAKSSK